MAGEIRSLQSKEGMAPVALWKDWPWKEGMWRVWCREGVQISDQELGAETTC